MTHSIVLTVGSLHYDIMVEADHLPRKDETAVGSRWYPKFGGKGGNQAVAVAKAGAQSRMFGAVGDDGFGGFLRAGLTGHGVDDRFVVTLPATGSGMSVAILDDHGDYAATIVSGANLRLDPLALESAGLWQDVGLLVLQNEVPEAINIAAAKAARVKGVRTILNAAPARKLSDVLADLVDILVVNAVEAEMMGAGPIADLSAAADAAKILGKRFPAVIVTAGALGLAVNDRNLVREIPAETVSVVSSHGAGDTFIGALSAALLRGHSLQEAAQAGSSAAARHVSTPHHET